MLGDKSYTTSDKLLSKLYKLRFSKHKNPLGTSCLPRNTFPNLCIFSLLIIIIWWQLSEVYINFQAHQNGRLCDDSWGIHNFSCQTTVFYFKKGNMIINWISVLIIQSSTLRKNRISLFVIFSQWWAKGETYFYRVKFLVLDPCDAWESLLW